MPPACLAASRSPDTHRDERGVGFTTKTPLLPLDWACCLRVRVAGEHSSPARDSRARQSKQPARTKSLNPFGRLQTGYAVPILSPSTTCAANRGFGCRLVARAPNGNEVAGAWSVSGNQAVLLNADNRDSVKRGPRGLDQVADRGFAPRVLHPRPGFSTRFGELSTQGTS